MTFKDNSTIPYFKLLIRMSFKTFSPLLCKAKDRHVLTLTLTAEAKNFFLNLGLESRVFCCVFVDGL